MSEMSNSNFFVTGVRLLGIYFLVQVPFSLVSIGMAISQDLSAYITDIKLYRITLCAAPVLLIIIGWLLAFKASKIVSIVMGNENGPEKSLEQFSQLSPWIIIIGLYYVVSSSAKIIQEVVRLPISSPEWYWWSQILSNAIIVLFSLVFIFKRKRVEAFINNHSDG